MQLDESILRKLDLIKASIILDEITSTTAYITIRICSNAP